MLAPMQGVTKRDVRALFLAWVRPDVIFTEFMRVRPSASGSRLSAQDLREAQSAQQGVPLVAQLIGRERAALVEAAEEAQRRGAVHLNLNLGCPFGRMSSGSGGQMLQRPEALREVLPALRSVVGGTLSVKVRSGYDDPEQIFSLLPLFESAGVDFLVLHPRTVVQEYEGRADHRVTARVVRQTRLPVIANGDVRTAAQGLRVLGETGAAGLMLGRGAISDPLLFERLRGKAPAEVAPKERAATLRHYLGELVARYGATFCGDAQVLANLRGLLEHIDEAGWPQVFKRLRRAKSVQAFAAALEELV
ncbi:MAG TPA: tRNA-dihydrouridine synthase family protein [Myxococcales bacterium]|jgi:tRNA-dihydrouridine synthase